MCIYGIGTMVISGTVMRVFSPFIMNVKVTVIGSTPSGSSSELVIVKPRMKSMVVCAASA